MINRVIEKFYLLFKLDINKYKEVLKQNEFIFQQERKSYLVIKFLTYFFIFFCACCFIYMYIILKQDDNFKYPYYYQNKLVYISLSDLSKADWVYILFGIVYLVSLYKIVKNFIEIGNNESDKFYKKNLLYSFDYVYYTSIFLIVIVRMILFFTLDDFQTFLNKTNLDKTYLLNSNNHNLVTEIAIGYYLLIIINLILMICIIVLFLSKSKLKTQYIDNKK